MRDFPVFTTENGVGSLVLREIPYSGIAYVTIHDSSFPEDFLNECSSFCRIAGAEHVYAKGHKILESYSLYTTVLKMSAALDTIPTSDASLFPVTEKTVDRWRELYNQKMKHVDNASFMSERAATEMLQRGDGYFVHRDGKLLGIGMASENHIFCVASVVPKGGREVVSALVHALMDGPITLEVASTNRKAIRLYESMGFVAVSEVASWYKIF